jgi:hypothetical protein
MSNHSPTIPKCIGIEDQYKSIRKKYMNDLFNLRLRLNDKELGEEERKTIIDQIKLVRGEIAEVAKLSLQDAKNKNNELGGMKK